MRKVLIQDNFYKSVPLEKKEKVEEICREIERQLNSSDCGIFGTYLAAQSIKFQGRKHLFKFRVSDGERIIFTYTKYLKNYRGAADSELYLIEYISQHDAQNRRARSFKDNTNRNSIVPYYNEETAIGIEEADEEKYVQYEKYLDLDNTITYVKDEDELSQLFQREDEAAEVYISNQQFQYVSHMRAALLLGGAGSGKTLVCLHKLESYRAYEGKKAYFTYSEGLKKRSEKIFNRISRSSDKANFYTIESYCLGLLRLKGNQFIDFFWFRKNFDMIKSFGHLPEGVSVVDIWAEIRGIIKGYMWSSWNRNFPVSFNEINEISRKVLEKKYGYIKAYNNDARMIICEDTSVARKNETIKRLAGDEELTEEQKELVLKDLDKIYSRSTTFKYGKTDDLDERLLSLEEYLNLGRDVSIYDREERRAIHAIAVKYQEYIDRYNLYDDNDLAGLSLLKMNKSSKKPFDFLVVDEVQDLTELQLYFMYNLVEDKDNIFFAGDIHQIINPTYFDAGRLKSLFSLKGSSLKEQYLNKNYRSQKYIVDLANRLAAIRSRFIARRNAESEEIVQAINDGQELFYLQKGANNLKQMLRAVNEKANAAVITADNEDKEYLEGLLGGQSNNIYTVKEIKGLEFDYVFCYNLTGRYSEFWKDILSERARHNAKYRYYFNIFYVSITRARKFLCVYNEEESGLFSGALSELFEEIKDYNEESLLLYGNDTNNEEWKERARILEEAEAYDKAILAYKRAKVDTKNIFRCEAKSMAKEKDYHNAIKIMLEIGEYEYAQKYAEDCGNEEMLVLAALLSKDTDYRELEHKYGKEKLQEVLAKNITNKTYGKLLNLNYMENYVLLNMLEDIDKINEEIGKLTGGEI